MRSEGFDKQFGQLTSVEREVLANTDGHGVSRPSVVCGKDGDEDSEVFPCARVRIVDPKNTARLEKLQMC